ncbi:MAG: hypothetical protein ACTHO8_02765 [Solirubrobacterales bacterium]
MFFGRKHLAGLGCAGALLLILFAAGCGGGGSTQAEGETLTKKQVDRRMQAYCHRGYLKQAKAMEAFRKAHGMSLDSPNQAERERVNTAVVLGFVEKRIAYLKSLPVPEGDEKEIHAIVGAMERGLEESRRNPASLAKPYDPEPFLENRKLTAAYGFWICGQA